MIDLLCQKMPASSLLRGILERCFTPERLDDLFERNAQEQYTRTLLFSTVCNLLLHVVLKIHPSVHAAYQAAQQEIRVSLAALYDKLNRTEIGLLTALVRETARDLAQVQDSLKVPRSSLLPGYPIRILDGNCLEASEKRLRVHRKVSGAALPGKTLAVLDPDRRLMVDVFPCEDGHAQERSLLATVLATILPGQLWIGDRNFCVLHFLLGIQERGAFALLRQHANLPFTEMGPWLWVAVTGDGRQILEQAITVGGRAFRRIRVKLTQPTRDGDTYVDLICNLPPEIEAVTIAELYRNRWRIETAFQQIEGHLESEINTLAHPSAALFGFCLALVAYNAFSLALNALDNVHQKEVSQTVSTYYVGHEIAATFMALLLLTDSLDWVFLAKLPPADFAEWLQSVASGMDLKKYKKHSRGPKKPRQKPPYDPNHPHVSTYKLLEEDKAKKDDMRKKLAP